MKNGACILGICFGCVFFGVLGQENALAAPVRNVILCIGDGMGPGQVKAARFFAGTNLVFESFPYQSAMTTLNAGGTYTDSAASSTAMASGYKVNNGVISVRLPGDGGEMETVLEYLKGRGKSVGLVSTTTITDATPAAFAAHEASRSYKENIAGDFLNQTRPNVLLGGGGAGMTTNDAAVAGYTVVTNANGLSALDAEMEILVSGQFGDGPMPYETDGLGSLPHLHEMVQVALNILDNDPDGFFLMVEGARIDHACHSHDLVRSVHETLEFSGSVGTVMDWMGDREDTLLIVTADHETGGLVVTNDNGAGNYPDVMWTNATHTTVPVPVYGIGLNAHLVTNVADNTDIHAVVLSSAVVPEECVSVSVGSNGFHSVWTAASGDVYRLEYTSDLMSTNWHSSSPVTSVSFRVSVTDTNLLDGARFYRLRSEGVPDP